VEKVAVQAGKAAPAMAIAGALVAAPTATTAASASVKPAASAAHHKPAKATLDSYKAAAVQAKASQHATAKTLTADTTYTVQSGDTLAKIASNEYHKASDWQWLAHENASKISNPDDIYPGESLNIPANPPDNYTLPTSDYQPRHAASSASDDSVVTQSASDSPASSSASASASGSEASASGSASESGTLGCSGLEQLWESAGGNAGDAQMAASIAMAESGGNQYAVSPTNDVGYWQINESNGSLATTDPYGNARAAIQLSDDGSNWGQWTTYASGAYEGKC